MLADATTFYKFVVIIVEMVKKRRKREGFHHQASSEARFYRHVFSEQSYINGKFI